MDINNLVSSKGDVFGRGHLLYKMFGGYEPIMDNSCRLADGNIYRTFPDRDDLEVEDLRNSEKDCVILIWEDFVSSRGSDRTNLKDRGL